MRHVEELLPELVMGMLSAEERVGVEEHLAQCDRCSQVLAEVADAISALAVVLPLESPPASIRERLLDSAAHGGRLHRFAGRVAEWLDLALDRARQLCDGIDRASSWSAGPIPGVELYHLPVGPRLVDVQAGFVRVRAGMHFPDHRHLGEERVLVIQGACRDSNGCVYQPGDEMTMPAGSCHHFDVLGGQEFVYFVRLERGFEFVNPETGDPTV
jgi:putative transcriptional regulator